jgi:hypothetical protein
VNLLRKLCFRGLKMVSAGPLFIGWAGHTRKNRGGCAGLTVSELGLSLLSFSGWTVASKPSRAGRWDANKRRGGGQGLLGVSSFGRWPLADLSLWFPIVVKACFFAGGTLKNLKADCPKCVRAFTPFKLCYDASLQVSAVKRSPINLLLTRCFKFLAQVPRTCCETHGSVCCAESMQPSFC